MSPTTADVLLHPVRLRIVLAFASGSHMTTAAISDRLPDVPHATLYRQVATLAEAGILEVVDERRVRGGVERTYALVADAAKLGPADIGAVDPDQLLHGFAVFAGALVQAFGHYVTDPRARPHEDPVGYRQVGLWLDAGEQVELVERLRAAVSPYLENAETPERQRLLLSTILIPELASSSDDGQDGDH